MITRVLGACRVLPQPVLNSEKPKSHKIIETVRRNIRLTGNYTPPVPEERGSEVLQVKETDYLKVAMVV